MASCIPPFLEGGGWPFVQGIPWVEISTLQGLIFPKFWLFDNSNTFEILVITNKTIKNPLWFPKEIKYVIDFQNFGELWVPSTKCGPRTYIGMWRFNYSIFTYLQGQFHIAPATEPSTSGDT